MTPESDYPERAVRISATEASRSFSRLLDRVEAGHRFIVHRHGSDVCELAPPAPDVRRTSEVLEILRGRGDVLLDGGFGEDLLAVLREEPIEERPSWGS